MIQPRCTDWDGDEQEDIIAGNSSGEIAFIRNLGGGKSWAEPVNFTVNGKETYPMIINWIRNTKK